MSAIDFERDLGFPATESRPDAAEYRSRLRRYINIKLAASGLPSVALDDDTEIASLPAGLLAQHRERTRLLRDYRCPIDSRIEDFLERYTGLAGDEKLRLPGLSFVLDRHGLARELALPHNSDEYHTPLLESYRCANGVLHNPKHDRRTTKGTFHVVAGGLPVPGDKKEVPKNVFVNLFRAAVNPPLDEAMTIPFTANSEKPARAFVSHMLRPLVCPEVPGKSPERTMEVRFFAPGSLVSNLDFVESIFGNGGDPFLRDNDAGLDVEHWTGHTGCVILAPHLGQLTKKALGLPHIGDATDRQQEDGMCWQTDDELYNDGTPCKITCRDASGVVVTIITDNYYGYCKKEVKTQLSYAANTLGNAEEEHAGGAIAFASYSLGDRYKVNSLRYNRRTFDDVVEDYSDRMRVKLSGYAIDRNFENLIYIPEDAEADVREQCVRWERDGEDYQIPLLPDHVYMAPSGYKIHLEKHPAAPSWRLIGTVGEGTFCHKPCTVSGGGKSEISKSLVDYMLYGPLFVANVEKDFDLVDEIFAKNYKDRWTPEALSKQDYKAYPTRPILSPRRSVGSVIKLLTPSADYTDEYNAWLETIPNHLYAVIFIIKRFYDESWDGDWRSYFGVDVVNGESGHQLKIGDRTLVGTYLRIGLTPNEAWRTFKLRQDFAAAAKIQTEDDISAATVIAGRQVQHLDPTYGIGVRNEDKTYDNRSVKFVRNCEYRLFQRPDDAIHRGLDKQTEIDLSQPGSFVSNFAPKTPEDVADMRSEVIEFDKWSQPMQDMMNSIDENDSFVVSSAHPRIVDGKPTKNPRYLQNRPDMANPFPKYVAEMGTRLYRAIPANDPCPMPVSAVLSGRRNNPPEKEAGIRSLAVYNPIHYQELPELFMDYVCSLTGKSPSTTGAGSEGAMTKGPFNMLRPAADLNAAFVSMVLTDLAGYSTAAGHIGPNMRVDHDISLLVPEIWCRLAPHERDPDWLISEGLLAANYEGDFPDDLPISRLGYRITAKFVRRFFGRIFDNPSKVFDDAILKPETQDLESFIDGIRNITEAQEKVAKRYLDDGTAEALVPPLRHLIAIMANGESEGMKAESTEFRSMFTRESVVSSDWYRDRLAAKQKVDIALWTRHVAYVESFINDDVNGETAESLNATSRLAYAKKQLDHASSEKYLDELVGTIGVQAAFA